MKPEVRIVPNSGEMCRVAAAEFVSTAAEAIKAKGVFAVALAGGSTPKALFSLMATDAELRAQVPWDKIAFFFGDERHVPPDHADSNYRMANESMLSKA
ncbi:MAG TPA: 6-phosphogluconolactonase, partial [Bryobacteraceae bacterium]|nr:6-phosphogluconolactonase [Bryobacteraceae bacterium]